jgi:hypothetical protein
VQAGPEGLEVCAECMIRVRAAMVLARWERLPVLSRDWLLRLARAEAELDAVTRDEMWDSLEPQRGDGAYN